MIKKQSKTENRKKEQLFEFLNLSFTRSKNIFDQVYEKDKMKNHKKLNLSEIFSNTEWQKNLDFDLKREFVNISIYLQDLLRIAPKEEVFGKVDHLLDESWSIEVDLRKRMISGLKRAFNEV